MPFGTNIKFSMLSVATVIAGLGIASVSANAFGAVDTASHVPSSPASPIATQPAPIAAVSVPAVVEQADPTPALHDAKPSADQSITAQDDETQCLAKIVLHEAGNQSPRGQLAVAQLVMNRVHSARFPHTICGVAMQHGQFFNVYAYHPESDKRWHKALDVAMDARNGTSDPVVGDALFFHANYISPRSFKSHVIVAELGAHIFYR